METPTRMRQLRMARGWKQRDVVEATGLNPATVSLAERGIASTATLAKIAAVFGEGEPERLLDRGWNAAGTSASVVQRNLKQQLDRLAPR